MWPNYLWPPTDRPVRPGWPIVKDRKWSHFWGLQHRPVISFLRQHVLNSLSRAYSEIKHVWKDLPWQNMILFSYFHKVKYVYWPLWSIWYLEYDIVYARLVMQVYLYLLTFSYETLHIFGKHTQPTSTYKHKVHTLGTKYTESLLPHYHTMKLPDTI